MLKIGTILEEKYKILKRIGEGGMSVVYLAIDLRLHKHWAVKEIKNNDAYDSKLLLRSLQMEAYVLKKVDHPVLPRIVDIVYYEQMVYVILDYIEGCTLSETIKKNGPQTEEIVMRWAKDLCGALKYLHSMQPAIIYRDMKPSNIMLKPDGTIKLIDFGTAKEYDVTSIKDTTALGTRGYAAPEQFGDAKGNAIYKTDVRTDIYSLGATLYHALTGKNPCEPPYTIVPIRKINATFSAGFEYIICKCTRPNPKERYQNCEELLYDLEHCYELDEGFRRECLHKIKGFFVCAGLTIAFGVLSLFSLLFELRQKNYNYEKLINQGYSYIVQQKYKEAERVYTKAIVEVDGSQSEAYLALLNLYINYMDDAKGGLERIVYYIKQEKNHIHKNQELLLQVAMNYFEWMKDYKTSAYYFDQLDEKKYPEARFYSRIALFMSEINVEKQDFLDTLTQFERINDEKLLSENKLMNYQLLCIIYARNLNGMTEAAQRLISVAEKAVKQLEAYDDDKRKAQYFTMYYQYLALAYEAKGDNYTSDLWANALQAYESALKNCDAILNLISADDNHTVSNITDQKLREAKWCQKAGIYEKMQKYDLAFAVYEQAQAEYAYQSIELHLGKCMLFCRVQEQENVDLTTWNRETILELYQVGCQIAGMQEDYRWKQFVLKISPLLSADS